jgi:two-component system, NarL family, response regulator LiaR
MTGLRTRQAYGGYVVPQSRIPVRVAVVDDYEIVVAGIAALLEPYAARVSVVELAVGTVPARGDVDVVLYDTFGHTTSHDVDLADLILAGTGKVVIFSWNLEPHRIDQALCRGAAGYLPKSLTAEEIVTALERVHAGETVRPHNAAATSTDEAVGWPGREHGLTHREAEIIALIAQGLSNQEIADRLYLSINSIKTHIRTAYRKIDVSRRSQAVGWAIMNGFDTEETSVGARD